MRERPRPEIHRLAVDEPMQVFRINHNPIRQVAREDGPARTAEELAAGLRPQPVSARDDVAFDDRPGLEGHGG